MNKIVGICGYGSTGSSAFTDLLCEFEDALMLDEGGLSEFRFTYTPDGLEDFEYFLKKYYLHGSSIIASQRFRHCINKITSAYSGTTKEIYTPEISREIDEAVVRYINRIIINSSTDYISSTKNNLYSLKIMNIARSIFDILPKAIRNMLKKNIYQGMNFGVMIEDFDKMSKEFISDILNILMKDSNNIGKDIVILNQPFLASDPVKSFKYFYNPSAIIVDRDPRDQYLFAKYFLVPRGIKIIPCENADVFVRYYRLMRQNKHNITERKDIIFFNFEELIYDYENTIKKIIHFTGVNQHFHKGDYFKPAHSRNNTQLFKKYNDSVSDINIIEKELSEYLFHFEDYPDIESEGGMFARSQRAKIL